MESMLEGIMNIMGIITLLGSTLIKNKDDHYESKHLCLFFLSSIFYSAAAFLCVDRLNLFLMLSCSFISAINFRSTKNRIINEIDSSMMDFLTSEPRQSEIETINFIPSFPTKWYTGNYHKDSINKALQNYQNTPKQVYTKLKYKTLK